LLRLPFLPDGRLPFTDLLTQEVLTPTLAAVGDGVPPQSVRFKATLQVLEAFGPWIA